ncbi:MAG TPA: SDR family NAD(P)-dependent oxidoreductase [Solirubrobacterales bacterium]|nr:SDR family NAD(P)-dependent oxidoreductase [Solirubrobacterales bacterium]
MELKGRKVLLTGATGGLGRAIALALAERGASVILSSRKQQELETMAASLPGDGHGTAPTDLAESGAAERLVEEAGDVEVLVANAGLPGTGRLDAFSPEEIRRALRVNLESPMLMARALAPKMAERGEGQLVFVASLAGKSASPRSSVYNATKFGLRGFALALRADLVNTGVGTSIVSPGFIRDAGMFADAGAKAPPGLGTATPEQVAAGVVKAIENDKVEVAVAPLRQRALAHFSLATPAFTARIMAGGAAAKSADALADGQRDKR